MSQIDTLLSLPRSLWWSVLIVSGADTAMKLFLIAHLGHRPDTGLLAIGFAFAVSATVLVIQWRRSWSPGCEKKRADVIGATAKASSQVVQTIRR